MEFRPVASQPPDTFAPLRPRQHHRLPRNNTPPLGSNPLSSAIALRVYQTIDRLSGVMAPPKGSTQRKSSASTTKASTPQSTEKTSKSTKPSKIVHLHLSPPSLLRFPHDTITQKSIPKKKSPLSISTPAPSGDPTPPPEPKSQSSGTPASPPTITKAEPTPPVVDSVKKDWTGPKTGSKRELGAGVEEPIKPKGKPGPKKKPRL